MIARTRVVLQEKDVIIIDPASARAGGVFERDVARSTILVACRSRDYSMAMSYTKIVLNFVPLLHFFMSFGLDFPSCSVIKAGWEFRWRCCCWCIMRTFCLEPLLGRVSGDQQGPWPCGSRDFERR